MALSARQILDLVLSVGWSGDDAIKATAVCLAESSGNPYAENPWFWTKGQVMAPPHGNGKVCDKTYCGDYSIGLFQINMRPDIRSSRLAYFGLASIEALYDPATNARVAFRLYSDAGRSFRDWGAYTTPPNNPPYLRFMPAARTAWALRAAEQPTPAVTPPNPPAGPAPIPAAAGPSSTIPAPSILPPAPAAASQPPRSSWGAWLFSLLSSWRKGTN